jgi:hypothetical protein
MKRTVGALSLLVTGLMLTAALAAAQSSKKEAQLRTVRGEGADKSEKPIENSVVFLKNLRTNVVLSHFTDAEGDYRFSGLDPNVDYEIHAEAGGEKSATRTVTSLDSRKEITMNLKIDRKKDEAGVLLLVPATCHLGWGSKLSQVSWDSPANCRPSSAFR